MANPGSANTLLRPTPARLWWLAVPPLWLAAGVWLWPLLGPWPGKAAAGAAALYFLAALPLIAALDWRIRIIPDGLVYPGLVLALAAHWAAPGLLPAGGVAASAAGCAAAMGVMTLLRWIGTLALSRRLARVRAGDPGVDAALGWGDVKLLGWLGAMLGWRGGLAALGLAAAIGAAAGVARGWTVVPFGLFLCLAGCWIFLARILGFC